MDAIKVRLIKGWEQFNQGDIVDVVPCSLCDTCQAYQLASNPARFIPMAYCEIVEGLTVKSEQKKKKVYISGKITGLDWENEVLPKFNKAEEILTQAGYEAINPCKINSDPNVEWNIAMREDIKVLMDCDYIYLMPCWEDSKGAQIEKRIAQEVDILNIGSIEYLFKKEKVTLSEGVRVMNKNGDVFMIAIRVLCQNEFYLLCIEKGENSTAHLGAISEIYKGEELAKYLNENEFEVV